MTFIDDVRMAETPRQRLMVFEVRYVNVCAQQHVMFSHSIKVKRRFAALVN